MFQNIYIKIQIMNEVDNEKKNIITIAIKLII